MLRNCFKYIIFSVLLATLGACTDDILAPDVNDGEDDGQLKDVYSLNFVVTLDRMGSGIETRADYNPNSDPASIRDRENYIDPERFRVLFFDHNNMFIFESKNRWIKRVDDNDYYSSWYVSVPLGPYGNDSYGEGHEYDWDKIHDQLTGAPFKIAILANRPPELQYVQFTDAMLDLPEGIFKNDGPVWGPEDSGKKSILDLHHCQYDIIYTDKGNHTGASDSKFGNVRAYYDFIMGDIFTSRPTMGASIHWASFENGDTDKSRFGGSSSTTDMRNVKLPSKDHPIPMYGVQEFSPIPVNQWKPGSAFDLSNEPKEAFPDFNYDSNTISLLRSCVRLDLKIPKSVKGGARPKLVTLWYSNIYSRCEPMDTWTNTKDIWKSHTGGCEWELIRDHGLIVDSSYVLNQTGKNDYQKKLSWYYGAWTDPILGQNYTWKFNRIDGKTMSPKDAGFGSLPQSAFPRIFNPCIQRNKVLQCGYADVSDQYNDNYWHYVIYTGERNMNDPNDIYNMAKYPYIETFMITWDNTNFYCVPLMQYGVNTTSELKAVFGPFSATGTYATNWGKGNWPSEMDTFVTYIPTVTNKNYWPYPLLRNHIYTFTLKGTKGDLDSDDMVVTSNVAKTSDINFSSKVKAKKYEIKTPVFKVNSKNQLKVQY